MSETVPVSPVPSGIADCAELFTPDNVVVEDCVISAKAICGNTKKAMGISKDSSFLHDTIINELSSKPLTGGFLYLQLVLEELKRAEREVHNRSDNDQGHYPIAEVVQYSQTRPNKEFDEVISGPRNNVRDVKPGCRGKASATCRYESIHSIVDCLA